MKQQLLVVAKEMTENGNRLQNYIDNFGDIITDMVKFLGSTSSINIAAIENKQVTLEPGAIVQVRRS
jgi:hypothetical protein